MTDTTEHKNEVALSHDEAKLKPSSAQRGQAATDQ